MCRQGKAGGQLSLLRNQENENSFPGMSTKQARKEQGQDKLDNKAQDASK